MPTIQQLGSPLKLAREALETKLELIYQDLTGQAPLSPYGVNWRYKSTMVEVIETRSLASVAIALDSIGDSSTEYIHTYDIFFRMLVANPDMDVLAELIDNHRYWFLYHVIIKLFDGVEITWNDKTYSVLENMKFYDEVSILEESPEGGGINTFLWIYKWTDMANSIDGGFAKDPMELFYG